MSLLIQTKNVIAQAIALIKTIVEAAKVSTELRLINFNLSKLLFLIFQISYLSKVQKISSLSSRVLDYEFKLLSGIHF